MIKGECSVSIQINNQLCDLCGECINLCPFNAIAKTNGEITINASCKLCKLCMKRCHMKAISMAETQVPPVDKDAWKGILVYVEHDEGVIHPVTFELIGKAKQLSEITGQKVYAVFMGKNIQMHAEEILYYGVETVFVYDAPQLEYFRVDVYTNALEDCIRHLHPSVVLIGATSVGRSLAPRIATRFRTGLTADCTALEMRENSDLVQIRPAFGGNIMAQILTAHSRPQFATVRYKVFDAGKRSESFLGKVEHCSIPEQQLRSLIEVKEVHKRPKTKSITDAEVLVVAGRGVKAKSDLALIENLASLLGGQVAATRPLIEQGWFDYTKQIGLSGRTVKPKLIITCGVSGAIQFVEGMKNAEQIVAINSDPNAPIMSIAHYCFVGDLYEILAELISRMKAGDQDAV